MRLQSQILPTLRAPEPQARLERIVAHGAFASRAALGREVCAQFGFIDARGTAQLAGCLKALTVLETAGQNALPQSRPHGHRPSPRRLDAPVPTAAEVPAQVRDVEGLGLVVVEDDAQRRVWNTLLATEHPHGTTTLVGCQIRYLIGSAHGWLGALGFSASALCLRARDTWMGWSDEQRKSNLHRVVCLSRFLIRPAVRCRHLASHALGRVLRRVGADFEARYGYRPWLVETFVEPEHDAASFKAANFVCVGHTSGRGRDDAHHARARSVKSVYIYELSAHWRRQLGVVRVNTTPSLGPGEGLDSARWAANELGGAPLGDKRLSARLVSSAALLASSPGHALGSAHDRAAVKGYYRLIDHPDHSQVTPANIVAPHRARTVERMRAHDTVLCIQDGTDLNFATRPGCEGLSIIGRHQTSAETLGLHLHLTLAVSGAGVPLGVLRCGFDEPAQGESEHGAERLQRALTIQAVIAWRVMLMTLLAREVPHFDAQLMFTDMELRFLTDYAADAALPAPGDFLGTVLLVAILGGYRNRKHDPRPVTNSCGEDTNACPPRRWATGLPKGNSVGRTRHSVTDDARWYRTISGIATAKPPTPWRTRRHAGREATSCLRWA